MLTIVKTIHVLCAIISICGFTYRGILKLTRPDRLRRKWLRIAPHVIDALLLVSAISLVFQTGYYPTEHSWVTAKIIALVVYILLGLFTLRFSKDARQTRLAFIGALLCYTYIIAVAINKSAWPF